MSNTDFTENAMLNHVFRNTPYTPPTTIYLALFTTATSDSGGGTEVTGNAYSRQPVSFSAPSPAGTITNSNTVTFPVANPGGWGTPTHWAVFDAVSGGNMLRQAPLTNPQAVAAGNNLSFPPGSIILIQD